MGQPIRQTVAGGDLGAQTPSGFGECVLCVRIPHNMGLVACVSRSVKNRDVFPAASRQGFTAVRETHATKPFSRDRWARSRRRCARVLRCRADGRSAHRTQVFRPCWQLRTIARATIVQFLNACPAISISSGPMSLASRRRDALEPGELNPLAKFVARNFSAKTRYIPQPCLGKLRGIHCTAKP